jgi:mannose-6-phosphate isomerase-like protein (cupin superfamily)
MFVTRKEKVETPLINATGEEVYKLIGSNPRCGGATHHSLAFVVIPPGGSSSHHFHKVGEETYYILKGRGKLIVNNKEHIVSPGDAIFISPNATHQIFTEGNEVLEFVVVSAPPWTPEDNILTKKE